MISIAETTAQEYEQQMRSPIHVYNSIPFCELNSRLFDKVHYLLFECCKYRLGIVLGQRGNDYFSPPSAPFGGFTYSHSISPENMDTAIIHLVTWVQERSGQLHITLPPLFYDAPFLSKCVYALTRSSLILSHIDINYHIPIDTTLDYRSRLHDNAKKNLNKSYKCAGYAFAKVQSCEEMQTVYDVIRQNREAKGYPLRMTYRQVMETTQIVPADFFLLQYQNEPVAAAIIFAASPIVSQVIYWGDVPGYSSLRPMNRLSYDIVKYYETTRVQVLDIGPSSENGVPNPGLCDFKESIGCQASLKYKFRLP